MVELRKKMYITAGLPSNEMKDDNRPEPSPVKNHHSQSLAKTDFGLVESPQKRDSKSDSKADRLNKTISQIQEKLRLFSSKSDSMYDCIEALDKPKS